MSEHNDKSGAPKSIDEVTRKTMDAITWARRLSSHIAEHLTPEQAANPQIRGEMATLGKLLASAAQSVIDLQLAVRASEPAPKPNAPDDKSPPPVRTSWRAAP